MPIFSTFLVLIKSDVNDYKILDWYITAFSLN